MVLHGDRVSGIIGRIEDGIKGSKKVKRKTGIVSQLCWESLCYIELFLEKFFKNFLSFKLCRLKPYSIFWLAP